MLTPEERQRIESNRCLRHPSKLGVNPCAREDFRDRTVVTENVHNLVHSFPSP
jgi:hypothetical protein